jgi:hypothetical protein
MADDVRMSGPLFDGRAEAALQRALLHIRHDVAAEGQRLAGAAFTTSIRANRGRFVSKFTDTDTTRVYTTVSGHKAYTMPVIVGQDETVVTNQTATYGPWLEGTGSRNHTTRFKGYNGMRRAAQALDQVAGAVADDAIRPYIKEMND